MQQTSIISVGHFRRSERVRLDTLVQQAGFVTRHAEDPDELQEHLDSPMCRGLLIDGASELVEDSLRAVRTHEHGRYVPVFLVAKTLDDLTFAQAFNLGADDVVTLAEGRPLLARLRRVTSLSLNAPPPGSKGAIVVDPDADRRVVRARALHNAGYDVRFAGGMEEAEPFIDDRSELLVLGGGRFGGLQARRESARRHANRDDFGFSYNISAGGLHVRTLAPPEEDTLWLELNPPRTDRRVRLDCRVAWRRQHDPATTATVPSGFAVEISEATRSSLAAWLEGYKALDAV